MAKLTKAIKAEDKTFLTKEGLSLVHIGRVTIVGKKTGNNRGYFSISICSKDEMKFKKSKGLHFALNRWNAGKTLPFEFHENMKGRLEHIAVALQE